MEEASDYKKPEDFKPGDSIGAFIDAVGEKGNKTIRWLGFGVYEGDFVPTGMGLSIQAMICQKQDIPMPRLKLDSGETIYGCECFWGDKDEMQVHLLDKADKIIPATVAEARTPPTKAGR